MPIFNLAVPDKDADKDVKVRTLTTPFGDGYVVDVADGLNPFEVTYQLSFSNRTKSQIKAVEDFLTERAGRRFTWTGPDGVTCDWSCKKWRAVYLYAANCTLSATFEKRHG